MLQTTRASGAVSPQAPGHRAIHALRCAIDGDVKIGIALAHDNGRKRRSPHLDDAMFVDASARAVDVGQANLD